MYVEISVAVLVNSHKISENIGNNGKILLLNLYNRHISFFGGLRKCAFLCAAPPNRLRPEGAGGFSFPWEAETPVFRRNTGVRRGGGRKSSL